LDFSEGRSKRRSSELSDESLAQIEFPEHCASVNRLVGSDSPRLVVILNGLRADRTLSVVRRIGVMKGTLETLALDFLVNLIDFS
jgi:catalase (peroxidase I)